MESSPNPFNGVEDMARTLFKRCVKCPSQTPSCPTCDEGKTCFLITQTCTQCASTSCVDDPNAKSSSGSGSGSKSPAGAAAGGVIGGIAVLAIIGFLVWRYYLKPRRQTMRRSVWNDDHQLGSEKDDVYSMRSDRRASTHTVASMASTFTRASNIIQIAYIPGVTNRSHSSPDLAPPVPPIPALSTTSSGQNTPQLGKEDEHFFMPHDIRNSTATTMTTGDTVRNSVASTVYRSNAIVSPVPAQMGTRGKATTVSVKNIGSNLSPRPGNATPPMPANAATTAAAAQQQQKQGLLIKGNIMGKVGQPKPIQITRKGSNATGSGSPAIFELDGTDSERSFASPQPPNSAFSKSTLSPFAAHSGYDDYSDASAASTPRRGSAIHGTIDSPAELGGDELRRSKFFSGGSAATASTTRRSQQPSANAELVEADSREKQRASRHAKSQSVNQMIEEAARKASLAPVHGGLGSYEGGAGSDAEQSPFADKHAAHTP